MARREPRPPRRPNPPEAELERIERVERVRPIHEEPVVVERPMRVVPTPLTRITHAVDYVFSILYGLLLIRLVLAMMGAREEAAFTRFIHGITGPLYAPFERIVSRPAVNGGYLDFPIIVAILAYVLLHVATRGLIRVVQGRSPTR